MSDQAEEIKRLRGELEECNRALFAALRGDTTNDLRREFEELVDRFPKGSASLEQIDIAQTRFRWGKRVGGRKHGNGSS